MNIKNLLLGFCLMLVASVQVNGQCLDGKKVDYSLIQNDNGTITSLASDWFIVGVGIEVPNLIDAIVLDVSDDMIALSIDNMTGTALPYTVPVGVNIELIFGGGIRQLGAYTATLDGSSTASPIISVEPNLALKITIPTGTVIDVESFAKINLVFDGCTPIPSMGQWALMILGLCLTSLAVVKIYNTKQSIA